MIGESRSDDVRNAGAALRTFVLVGHCGPDVHLLKRVISRAAPGAAIEVVDDEAALTRFHSPRFVLLVNRKLDGMFEATGGIELISSLAQQAEDARPALMLVSNFADAQAEAQAVGALPGFGKAELGEERTNDRLRSSAAMR